MNYVISCSARINKKTKGFHPQLIGFFNIWNIYTTKHSGGVVLLKLCRILDHRRVMDGWGTGNFSYYCQSQMHQRQLAFLSWWRASTRHLPASKTVLQQHRTCLHRSVLLHGRQVHPRPQDTQDPTVWPSLLTQTLFHVKSYTKFGENYIYIIVLS